MIESILLHHLRLEFITRFHSSPSSPGSLSLLLRPLALLATGLLLDSFISLVVQDVLDEQGVSVGRGRRLRTWIRVPSQLEDPLLLVLVAPEDGGDLAEAPAEDVDGVAVTLLGIKDFED